MAYEPSKLGETDLVFAISNKFGLWSEFISRSVHAKLQVPLHAAVMCNPG